MVNESERLRNNSSKSNRKACVIGAGPNGLAAAIVLAQAGLHVDVMEAQPHPCGAARTLELTLPAFHHDFGSAVYPLGAGSPFFSSLPLSDHGVEWIQPPAPVAHPFDDVRLRSNPVRPRSATACESWWADAE